jgi:hypothetical protein
MGGQSMYANIREVDDLPPNAAAFQCFEMLAPVLLAFASRHSLLVRRFYHGQPMWSFHFLHPKGGFGMVQIHAALDISGGVKAAVASHWWVDDLEKSLRSSLSTKSVSFQGMQPEDVVPVLESAFRNLLALTPAELSSTSQTMPRKRDDAGNYVFSEFERAQRLPS